ncbi:FAD/FMN-containing dehydrogenase [Pseudomonas sp. KNUC1026]|uniref:FAD/FMN-containing dehydrogenase n=1 Tax=Pseudomonas sp. KNUC1026 TaxID=2893890 RepID=UPI001F3FC39D|nr:FAD/FMN-containing dehydrogenase [Pseudomonas sp. KNUC1026]UFH47990.1 FAD/FMN-containing dehydrogenase [Pseudomonas sp. KNUC1026]
MTLRHALAACLLCLPLLAQAAEPGDPVPAFTLLDQFDAPFTLGPDTQLILVARSMGAAKLMDAALKDQPSGYLEARHAVYVADIERMPAVAKLFAIPSMRSAKYRILLDQEARVAAPLDGDRDTVQWLAVKSGKVAEVKKFADAQQLRAALESAAKTAG